MVRAALIVLLVLAVGAAAFLFGRTEAVPDRAPQQASPERGVDLAACERLSRSVESLQASVDRLSRRLDEWMQRGETRPGAANQPIVADRFELQPRPGAQPTSADPTPSIRSAPDPERRKRLDDLKGKEFLETNRAHWFWTFEDAVQAYGPPDEIHPIGDGQVNFVYRMGDRSLYLQFYAGRLLVLNWY